MRDAEIALRSSLETLRNASGKLPNDYSYTGPADFVLREGRFFRPRPLPVKIKLRKLGLCFHNALWISTEHGFAYVEGYAVHAAETPILHAWNIDAKGFVIDTTWRPVGSAYFGVILPVAEKLKWRGSLIDNWENGWPLLDIDLIDFPCEKMDTTQHLACSIYNRCEIKIAGRHLVKHRCEQEKVLTINEGDFDGRALREVLSNAIATPRPAKPPPRISIRFRCASSIGRLSPGDRNSPSRKAMKCGRQFLPPCR